MVVLDGNFALGYGPEMDYPWFQCMLEQTDAITNEFPKPFTFVLAYPTEQWFHSFNRAWPQRISCNILLTATL